jgi:outer membrane protein
MKQRSSILAGMSLAVALIAPVAPAQTQPVKLGVINMQAAMVQSKDGQKAAAALQAKFAPKQAELDKKQQDLAAMQDQLRKGQNTMSDENKQKLARDIDVKTNSLKRDMEDANADLEGEQQRITGELGGKIMTVLNKYATDNGFALVLDVGNQQTPVMFASNAINITGEIVTLYDKSSTGLSTLSSAPQSAPAVSKPTPAAPRPAAAAPVKPSVK